jgi:hypothetical protein
MKEICNERKPTQFDSNMTLVRISFVETIISEEVPDLFIVNLDHLHSNVIDKGSFPFGSKVK